MWEFSKKKSNWMCLKNGKRDVENIEVEVKQGKLEKTKSYKLLGNYINEQGNLDDQLKYMETKAVGVVREGNKLCCQNKVGKAEFEAKKLVYEMQMVPAVFFNLEVWTNLRKSDVTRLESIQGKIMRGSFGLPKSTPYWGLLYELNILPIMLVLTYKKIMLYHNIINSDDRRVAKQIVKEQEKSGLRDCWFGNVQEEGEKIGIKIHENVVKGKLKSKWKKEVKRKIRESFRKGVEEKKKTSKKMRFLKKSGSDTYLKDIFNEDARTALKIRLNMIDWITDNYGRRENCPLCGHEDNTEHVLNCASVNSGGNVTTTNLELGDSMKDIVDHFNETEKMRREVMVDNVLVNFDVLRRDGELEE